MCLKRKIYYKNKINKIKINNRNKQNIMIKIKAEYYDIIKKNVLEIYQSFLECHRCLKIDWRLNVEQNGAFI